MRLILLITVILAITYVQLKADLINQIKLHEGYDNKPYKDGYSYSVGYGTQLPITKAEATLLLIHRLSIIDNTFKHTYPWYHSLPTPIKNIVLNMGYNLGTRGFSKFKKMHYQLARHHWVKAAIEMKSSLWYRQTKTRAHYLYNLMRNYKG